MNGATEVYQESLWPPVAALRETALLLVALLLVALLAGGDLALLLSSVLILAWGLLSFRGEPGSDVSSAVPMLVRLLPVFAAILIAQEVADDHWFPFALVAIAAPLFVLARVGLVLQRRQRHATP